MSWVDYNTPLGEDMTKRFIRRHRLEKMNPNAAVSETRCLSPPESVSKDEEVLEVDAAIAV